MRNSLADVVSVALRVLDEQGLEGCSMRRVAAELGVQPSALYHHVHNKQSLLALMADEIVKPVRGSGPREVCEELRNTLLAVRDGAEVVATALALRPSVSKLEARLAGFVGRDGAQTLLIYTLGHAQLTQTRRQAFAFDALVGDNSAEPSPKAAFLRGLDLILRGLGQADSLSGA